MGHGALDLLAFGAWEIIGIPIEAMQGETFTLTIEYDKNDKVKKVYIGQTEVGGNMRYLILQTTPDILGSHTIVKPVLTEIINWSNNNFSTVFRLI